MAVMRMINYDSEEKNTQHFTITAKKYNTGLLKYLFILGYFAVTSPNKNWTFLT